MSGPNPEWDRYAKRIECYRDAAALARMAHAMRSADINSFTVSQIEAFAITLSNGLDPYAGAYDSPKDALGGEGEA